MSLQVNYDDVIRQLEAGGIDVTRGDRRKRPPVFDGSTQRWKEIGGDNEWRGWSRLKEWTSAYGNTYIVGYFGVWQGNVDGFTKIELPQFDKKTKEMTEQEIAERDALRLAQKEAAKRLEAERKLEAARAGRWAATVWHHCAPAADHEYLTRKLIRPHGVRVMGDAAGMVLEGIDDTNFNRLGKAAGALVVPMHDAKGSVCGIQLIYPKGHDRLQIVKGGKEFWPTGMAMGGSFGVIGHLRRTGVLLVAEGYATAASLHEATGQSVLYAFSANNLAKAARQIRKAYPGIKLLFCADDDYLTEGNPGVKAASEACAEMDHAAWVTPDFTGEDGADLRGGKKLTDFNDLLALTGLPPILANQINDKLDELGWRDAALPLAGASSSKGGGEAEAMAPRLTIDEAARRFWGTYGLGGKALFDEVERRLVHKDDVLNLLPSHGWDELKKHPAWRVARDHEIGFDPTERDATVKCNMFGGWPTTPRDGRCDRLLELLLYLCSKDGNARDIYHWILCWLAYPLQHRGAKMHSAILIHGPQGTGKSRFFEAVADIYGQYGRVLGQDALEDKFNADWAEKKLFIVGDEVMAKIEMYHVKNRLKGFITGSTIRVNPKNVAAHTEKNQMNIVFLSNERQPMILENDDRRHLVIWTPPKPDDGFFAEVNAEIAAGGVAALHHYLLNLDLGDFRPWTKPPMTEAKQDLIDLGLSSEERFLQEWQRLEIEGKDSATVPFCPCQGSHLYRVYEDWCKQRGEFRPRPANHFMNFFAKQGGWSAGKSSPTWATLRDKTIKNRKMVIPGDTAMIDAIKLAPPGSPQHDLARERFGTKAEWLTACFFAFEHAIGGQP